MDQEVKIGDYIQSNNSPAAISLGLKPYYYNCKSGQFKDGISPEHRPPTEKEIAIYEAAKLHLIKLKLAKIIP